MELQIKRNSFFIGKSAFNTKDEKIQISQIVANDENKDIPQIEENSEHMIVRR